MLKRLGANLVWTATHAAAYRRHVRAARAPRAAQERQLLSFLRRNADSAYGRAHGFGALRSVGEFQARVPIVTYDQLEPWIQRIRAGEPRVLTCEAVLALEKTGGSSGAIKYVPYTATLLREFRNAIGAWLFDLFTRRPALLRGAHYWSITPLAARSERGPIPVGLESDAEYFGPLQRRCLRHLLAVPDEVARAGSLEACLDATLRHLLRARDLRFLSVWSPSFLTTLLRRLPPGVEARELWPDLTLISCWTCAAAERFLPELRELLPGVEIQGKGLLATEGVVTIPLTGRRGCVPALASHFLEFVDDKGCPRLVDELELGARYRPLLTTGGGLVRYDLGDVVEVVAPGALEFVGKAGVVSDLVGEKLTDAFVGHVLSSVRPRHPSTARESFLLLAPVWGRPPGYVLLADAGPGRRLVDAVERGLRESPQYDYARRLGQLGPLRLALAPDGAARYAAACVARGQRAGDVKLPFLAPELDWLERLAARAPRNSEVPA